MTNLFKNFFSGFDKKKDFKTVLDACTNNYECLVLDNTRPTTNIAEVCFFYKAKLGRKFKFGSKKLWQFHDKWYLNDDDRSKRDERLKKKALSNNNNNNKLSNGLIVNKKNKK